MTPAETSDLAKSILASLVSFDTTSRNSNLDLVRWVQDYLAENGVHGVEIPSPDGNKANLHAVIGPADVPGYVLSGHTDVVPVDGQAWNSDPFVLTERDGRLYGRGTCDMKGFLAACLAQVPAMVAAPLARPIHLAFSYDEEVGCIGVRSMIAEMAAARSKPLACFVGEPTSMNVVVGHKGKRSIRTVVTGRSCHSSLAPQGVNAVHFASRIVARIADIADRLAASGPRDSLYDVSHSTAHVGALHGGTALNIVADRAEFVWEVRVVGADDVDALVAEIVSYAKSELEPAMRAVAPEAGIEFHDISGFPGLDIAPDHPAVTLAKRLARRNEHSKVAYGTEAGLFMTNGGIPAVIIGPGDIEQAHKPDEYLEVEQLAEACAFVGRLVEECR
jgi:acetylornithine deacetylase